MDNSAERDPRVYFAAERTFLAWIRTGLGLTGVGFAIARFGFMLRQLAPSRISSSVPTTGISEWSGVALVCLGVIVNLSAVFNHYRLIRELKSGTWIPGRMSGTGIGLALLLAAVGIGMGIYLVAVR